MNRVITITKAQERALERKFSIENMLSIVAVNKATGGSKRGIQQNMGYG